MRNKVTLSILLVVGLLMILTGVLFARVYALTLVDPWTTQAATFNPKGVKFGEWVTTGNELKVGYKNVWTETQGVNAVKALNEISK